MENYKNVYGDRQLFPLSNLERIIENFEGGI